VTMPQFHSPKDARFHIFKAERNEAFYAKHNMSSMDSATFNEWAVVILFYISMHYIDAVLSQDTSLPEDLRDPGDHPARNRAVSQCPGLISVGSMYLNLYQRGRDARYNRICFPNDYVYKLEKFSFKPVREYVRKQLGLP
jgi:hypothetical protein